MDHQNIINRKVNEALESLDGLVPASPAPFFYTRLEARLLNRKRNFWELAGKLITRPAIAGFSVALVLSVNVLVAATSLKDSEQLREINDIVSIDQIVLPDYDLENDMP